MPSEHGRNIRSDWMSFKPVKTVRDNLGGFSEPRQGSVPTGVTDGPDEMGKMRPARMQKRSWNKSEHSIVSRNDLAGRVAVDATPSAVLAGDAAVGAASLVGFAGSVSPDVILPPIAEGTPLADCVGVAPPTGRAEVFSMAVAAVVSSADISGAVPPAVTGMASPAVLVEVMPLTDSVGLVDCWYARWQM